MKAVLLGYICILMTLGFSKASLADQGYYDSLKSDVLFLQTMLSGAKECQFFGTNLNDPKEFTINIVTADSRFGRLNVASGSDIRLAVNNDPSGLFQKTYVVWVGPTPVTFTLVNAFDSTSAELITLQGKFRCEIKKK